MRREQRLLILVWPFWRPRYKPPLRAVGLVTTDTTTTICEHDGVDPLYNLDPSTDEAVFYRQIGH